MCSRVHFVPGHPVAGTKHSGPESGFAELFAGRWCILIPLPETPVEAHLPQLIAYTIVAPQPISKTAANPK